MENKKENAPNIIWIQSDQHNPAVIGAYGDKVVETPNLDKLAENGEKVLPSAFMPPLYFYFIYNRMIYFS